MTPHKLKLNLKRSYPIFETVYSTIPLIGYRSWNLRPDGGLGSLAAHYTWDGPVCVNKAKPVLFDGAQRARIAKEYLGFYMAKRPADIPYIQDENFFCIASYFVAGRCSLFGRVIEAQFGYRAEKARIDLLLLPEVEEHMHGLSATLEQRYQVEVKVMKNRKAIQQYLEYLEGEGT